MKTQLLTSENICVLENTVITEGILEETLMERAGKNVAEVIFKHFSPSPTVILCGLGKNGGDGKITGDLLKEKGWPVEIISLQNLPPLEEIQESLNRAELIVDALLGRGLNRPLEGNIRKLVSLINKAAKPVVAIDIPTGIDTDSGACCGEAVQALFTITFVRARPGHYLLPGRIYTGKLFVTDIGIPDQMLPPVCYSLNNPSLWEHSLKKPQPSDHKYTRGACLLVGNGSMPGAVKLAALAARRIGAGLVCLTCKTEDYPIFACTTLGDIIAPLSSPQDFLKYLNDTRYKVLLGGTGALPNEEMREQTLLLLSTKKPCVLDGGALSSFEGQIQKLIAHLHQNVILTPHEGEFIRLFPHFDFIKNKTEKALKAAAEGGAIIVLKGYDTVIASPQGDMIINANAPTTLATAGSGDVLAGLLMGLLAQGLPPLHAAAAAVWIHGEAANHKGLGLIAEDLVGEIPAVLQTLNQN